MNKLFRFLPILLIVLAVAGWTACKEYIFYAQEGSTLLLVAEKTNLRLNESVVIHVSGYLSDGTPLWDDTTVELAVDNGTLDRYRVLLKDGRAQVTAAADQNRGEMNITAWSGSVYAEPNPLILTVGQIEEVNKIVVNLNPATLPPEGGTCKITSTVLDQYNNPLSDINVYMEADEGRLHSGGTALVTNSSGRAIDYLTTEYTSNVTVYAGEVSKTVTVEVEDGMEPVAQFTFSPADPVNNETVYFNASESYDSDGHIVKYEWDFGDGNTGNGKTETHAFNIGSSTSKTFSVTLTVTDNSGFTDSISRDVTVEN